MMRMDSTGKPTQVSFLEMASWIFGQEKAAVLSQARETPGKRGGAAPNGRETARAAGRTGPGTVRHGTTS